MSNENSSQSPHQQRLNQVVAEYLDAVEAGRAMDREEVLAQNPELAGELKQFFADHDRMRALAQPIPPADTPAGAHLAAGSPGPTSGSTDKSDDAGQIVASERAEQPPARGPEDSGAPDTDASTLPPTIAQPSEPATLPPTQASGLASVEAAEADADTATVLPPGSKVRYFGDYELLEEIARGGMGVVYKARQVSLNRIVALKMILAGQLAGAEDVKRFHAEAEAAANLDHPGIVPIYEVGCHEGQHYFSMGYVEGESLAERLRDGPLPPREAAELVRQVAEAVQYAHEHGVIHRDLKPANVLLEEGQGSRVKGQGRSATKHEGAAEPPRPMKTAGMAAESGPRPSTLVPRPRITDFGLAKRVEGDSHLTASGQILGTPSYMPPEQASGKLDRIGPVSDVYALGAILYARLTGRPPFQAASPLDTVMQVLERDPVAPRELNPNIPRDLETICLKCLEKDTYRRYPRAMEAAEELQRFLNGEPVQARPVSRLNRAWRWCRRNRLTAALLIACVTILLAAFAGVTWQWIRAEQSRARLRDYLSRVISDRETGLRMKVQAAGALWKLDGRVEDVLPPLIQVLKTEDKYARERAAEILADIGAPAKAAIPSLIEAAKDPMRVGHALQFQDGWHEFLGAAAWAIARMGVDPHLRPALIEAVADVADYADNGDDTFTTFTPFLQLLDLIDSDPEKAVPQHLEALRSGGPGGRIWAAEYLMRAGPSWKTATPLLAAGLRDTSIDARRWSASALIKLGPLAVEAVPALADALGDEDPGVRWRAAVALGAMGRSARRALPELREAARDDRIRPAAEWTQTQIQRGSVAAVLARLAHLDDVALPAHLSQDDQLNLCGGLQDALAADAAGRGSSEQSARLIKEYTAAMRHAGLDSDARRMLVKNLTYGRFDFKGRGASIADAIKELHSELVPLVVASLIDVLRDRSPSIQLEAASALTAFPKTAPAAVPALIVALENHNRETSWPWLAREAILTLAAIGPEANGAIPALREAAERRVPYTRVPYTGSSVDHALIDYALAAIEQRDADAVAALQKLRETEDVPDSLRKRAAALLAE